jgi:two-component system cell cycle response regulator
VIGPTPAARVSLRGRTANSIHRVLPWLAAAALLVVPAALVFWNPTSSRRAPPDTDGPWVLALLTVGVLLGYGMGALVRARRVAGEQHAGGAPRRARPSQAASPAAASGELNDSLDNLLTIVAHGLEPHAVALFVLGLDRQALVLEAQRPGGVAILPGPHGAGADLWTAALRQRRVVALSGLPGGAEAVIYYDKRPALSDVVVAPVMADGRVLGVLVADRVDGRVFCPRDIRLLESVAAQFGRALQLRAALSALSREKRQKERFYQASRDFSAARTVEQVAKVAISAAKRVVEVEFAAVVVAGDEDSPLSIVAAEGADGTRARQLVGRVCSLDSLVGRALGRKRPTPGPQDAGLTLFGPGPGVTLGWVQVLPLVWKNLSVGALVIGHGGTEAIAPERLDLAGVMADHAAVAIANARLYERMERMATTDGLTGLVNHRQFQAVFDAHLARAQRYGRKLSLIFTDIDHFKEVNDKHGHPIGDQVLKRVAAIMRSTARRTDVVARYGGEEFAVLMEETGHSGAQHIAERIRKAVEAEVFQSEAGAFHCTLSLGVATFPEDGPDKYRLTACADQALYLAKRSGRNQTSVFSAVAARVAS